MNDAAQPLMVIIFSSSAVTIFRSGIIFLNLFLITLENSLEFSAIPPPKIINSISRILRKFSNPTENIHAAFSTIYDASLSPLSAALH